jgi:ribonuclease PH
MTDYVTACSIGHVNEKTWILDTNGFEEQHPALLPSMTVVVAPRNKQLLCLQVEPPSKLSLDHLAGWLESARVSAEIIHSKLDFLVKQSKFSDSSK